jgi:hypothetical protein
LADKISANAVTADKINANAVTAAKIDAGAVTAGKIAANAVTAGTIAANAVTAGTIAAAAVSATEIAAGAITSTKIYAGAVDTDALAANAVTAGKIEAGAVTAGKISVTNLAAINANLGTVTAGSLTASAYVQVGTGASQVLVNTSGFKIGRDTDYHILGAAYAADQSALMFYNGSNVLKGFLTLNSGGIVLSGTNQNGDQISSFGLVSSQVVKALSSADPGTTDAPLYTAGGAWIAKTLNAAGNIEIAGFNRLQKETSDGWSPTLFDGAHDLEFRWDGSDLQVRIDHSTVRTITTTP